MELNSIPFANETITVYNQYTTLDEYGKSQLRWTSYVFKNAMFRKAQQTKVSEMVSLEGDYFVAQAPNNDDYLPYLEWIETTDVGDKFTVQNGDVVILGELVQEIPVNSSPTVVFKYYAGRMFTAKTAQANISADLPETSHFYWGG